VEPPPRVGAPLGSSIADGPTAGGGGVTGPGAAADPPGTVSGTAPDSGLGDVICGSASKMAPSLPPLWLGDAQQEPHQLVPQSASSSARLAARGAWLEDHLPLASRCLGRCGRARGGG